MSTSKGYALDTDLVLGLIDVIPDPGRWPAACDLVSDAFGSRAFLMFEFDFDHHNAPIMHGSQVIREEGAALAAATQAGVDGEERAIYARFVTMPFGRFISEYQLYGVTHDRDMPENAVRDAQFRVGKSRSRTVAKLNGFGPWADVASFHMPIHGADIPDDLRARMDGLSPVLDRVLEAGRTVRGLTRSYGLLVEMFDAFHFGAAIVDGSGAVVLQNRAFQDMAADRDGFRLQAGRVVPTLPEDRAALSAALSDCLTLGAAGQRQICKFSRQGGRPAYVVRSIPLQLAERRTRRVYALLVVLDPEDSSQVSADGIAAMGRLSPAEAEICELIVRGLPLTEIAQRRDRSVETIRNQSKAVLAKMDCRSRLDLLRLAMMTKSPLK